MGSTCTLLNVHPFTCDRTDTGPVGDCAPDRATCQNGASSAASSTTIGAIGFGVTATVKLLPLPFGVS